MTDNATRIAAAYAAADEHRLQIEGASVPRADTAWWAGRMDDMAEAHRTQARALTAQALALRPAPDNAQSYPPEGEDAW